jgi:SRSO17 transposase
VEAVHGLGDRLHQAWQRFADCFQTKTRDGSQYAYHYLSGLLRMKEDRNFANIGRQTGVPGQNMQHFMSNSPWSPQPVFQRVQQEIKAKPGLGHGGVLLLDESADEKAGQKSVGAARQYNGRMGKVDLSQVGVFLAYVNVSPSLEAPVWTWVDGEVFLPEHWFSKEMAAERQRLGVPKDRAFATKVELGWQMIERAVANGLPFEALGCDDLYGRSSWFRRNLARAGIVYMADVPVNTQVYLTPPSVGVPAVEPGRKGRPPGLKRVLSDDKPVTVREVYALEDTPRQRVRVRSTERGEIDDEFAVRRVWTDRDEPGVPVSEEWMVIRREGDGKLNCSLSNAPAATTIERLAWLKCQRYFIERANEDSKTEIGWDEFQAQKYRAWKHHLALTVLATWFIAETKLDWARQAARDPSLARQFEVEVLPMLSVANVREMLRAAMPLAQLTPQEATELVVKHLVNRTRARKSRIKHRYHSGSSP